MWGCGSTLAESSLHEVAQHNSFIDADLVLVLLAFEFHLHADYLILVQFVVREVKLLEQRAVDLKLKNRRIFDLLDACLALPVLDADRDELRGKLPAHGCVTILGVSYDQVSGVEWHRLYLDDGTLAVDRETLAGVETPSVLIDVLYRLLSLSVLLLCNNLGLIRGSVDNRVLAEQVFVGVDDVCCYDVLSLTSGFKKVV